MSIKLGVINESFDSGKLVRVKDILPVVMNNYLKNYLELNTEYKVKLVKGKVVVYTDPSRVILITYSSGSFILEMTSESSKVVKLPGSYEDIKDLVKTLDEML